MLKPYIAKVINNESLTAEEAEAAMTIIMTGKAMQAQIGAYLVALRMKGETVPEITGSARAMRSVVSKVEIKTNGAPLVDIVGTGGDGAHTFNISTSAAFVTAGAGRMVAKHGNRSVSSLCGSADVLEELGVNLGLTPEQVSECVEEVGIGFMFAPKFHPAMKHAIGPRRELGQRTIFNILGPLTNPAGATHLMMGVFDSALTEPLAEVLGELGSHAYVVHSSDGLDELTTGSINHVSHVSSGDVKSFDLDPVELGLQKATRNDLKGGDASENAKILRAILAGKDTGPRRDVVLLNAAAALSTESGDLAAGLAEAKQSLESGAALAKLDALAKKSQSFG